MIAKLAIDENIPFIKPSDKVHFVIELLEEYKLYSLPIVENEILLGIVSEDQLLDVNENLTIEQLEFPFFKLAANEYLHVFDVLKLKHENNANIIPVINEKEKYIGLITSKSLLDIFNSFSFVTEKGGIFILEVDIQDYSLAEITRIIESNKSSVLSVATSSVLNSIDKINVTIKVSTIDLTYILASLERYEYNIVSVFHKAEQIDQLKERYDALMHYINI